MRITQRFVWMKVYGPSMSPTIPSGTEVLLDIHQKKPISLKVVAFKSLEKEIYLHRILYCFSYKNSRMFLESGDGDDIFSLVMSDSILGTAIAFRHNGILLSGINDYDECIVRLDRIDRQVLRICCRIICRKQSVWRQAFFGVFLPTILIRVRKRKKPNYSNKMVLIALKSRFKKIIFS